MGEPKNLGLAAAVAGGYLLGRGKKGQMALTAAALLAGRGLRPGALVAGGIRKVPGVPAAFKGGQDEEPDATEGTAESGKDGGRDGHGAISRAARHTASSVANRGLTALTDALHERTAALSDADADEADEGVEETDGDAHENEDEADDTEEPSETEPEPETSASQRAARKPAPRRRAAKKPVEQPERAAKKTAPKKRASNRTTAAKNAPKKRTASKKPAAAKAPAGKKPSPARKTTAKKSQPTKKAATRTRRER